MIRIPQVDEEGGPAGDVFVNPRHIVKILYAPHGATLIFSHVNAVETPLTPDEVATRIEEYNRPRAGVFYYDNERPDDNLA